MQRKIFILVALIAFECLPAFALETAKVLPKGVRRFWLVGITSNNVDQRYSSAGQLESVVTPFNKTLGMKDFQRSEPKLRTLVNQLNDVQKGLGNSLEAYSNVYNDYTIRKDITIPSLQYGVTDRLTLSLRTDITRRIVTNKFSATSISNSDQILNEVGTRETLPEGLTRGLETLRGGNLNSEFVAYRMYTYKGYHAPENFNRTDLGDTELAAKYKVYGDDYLDTAVQSRVIIPTGKDRPIDNPYDPGSGIGTWGTTLEIYQEYTPFPLLTLEGSAQGRYYFADTKRRAVPLDDDDNLPSLRPEDGQVHEVRRLTGKELRTELATIVNIPGEAFKVWGAYQYWVKGKDKFNGPGDLYYQGLSKYTDYNISTWELGARFSTINLFRQKKFRAPLEIDALYNSSFKGRNIREASYGRVDLKFYF